MIRYGIFDVDGTLLDSMGVWHQASARLLEQYHIPMPLDLDEKLAALSLRGGSEYLSHHLLPQLTPEQVREEIDRLLREEYRLRIPLKEGVREQLERLQRQGTRMIIATAGINQCAREALTRLRILPFFEGMVNCADVGTDKNSPLVFLEAARRLGASPQEAVVFEDAPHAIRTAQAAGFPVVGIPDPWAAARRQDVAQLCGELFLPCWSQLEDLERRCFP